MVARGSSQLKVKGGTVAEFQARKEKSTRALRLYFPPTRSLQEKPVADRADAV
jgi:hypothetical protein